MKTMKSCILAAAVALAISSSTSTFADVLDEGLGGPAGTSAPTAEKKPEPRPAEVAPEPKKEEPKLTRPKMPDLVSPDAAKTVDDQDLLDKLTGKGDVNGGEGGGPEKKMKEVMERMGQAENRLAKEQDPGLVTQETQRRIVTDLDVMIEYLKKQEQQSSGKPGEGKPKPGEGKKPSQGQQSGSAPANGEGGNEGAKDSQMRAGSADTPQKNGTELHDNRLNWGNLPPGEREAVANGANEHFLPEYRDMINKYYQALAELGKSKGR
jgi:hypothetical protein